MANSAWQATIQDSSGNIVEGAEVQVLFESSGTPATIYSDRAGTPLVNPFLTGSTGFAQFYAPAGNYRVVATKDTFTNTWRDQRLGESQGYDVQSNASDFTAGRVALTDGLSYVDPRQFGLGGESELSVIDWNNLDEATLLNPVLSNSGSLNGPPSSEPYYYPQVMKYQNGNVVQIAWPYRVGIGGVWIRSRFDTAWTSWLRLDQQAFGVGVANAPDAENSNMNNCLTGGMYSCANVTTPYPSSVNSAATLFVIPRLNGSADHEVTQILEWRSQTWRRYRMNGVWSSWSLISDTDPAYYEFILNPGEVLPTCATYFGLSNGWIAPIYLPVKKKPTSITILGQGLRAYSQPGWEDIAPTLDVATAEGVAVLQYGASNLTIGEDNALVGGRLGGTTTLRFNF